MSRAKLTPEQKAERAANRRLALEQRAERARRAGRATTRTILERLQGARRSSLVQPPVAVVPSTRFGLGHRRGSVEPLEPIGPLVAEEDLRDSIEAIQKAQAAHRTATEILLTQPVALVYRGEPVQFACAEGPWIVSTRAGPYVLQLGASSQIKTGPCMLDLKEPAVVTLLPSSPRAWFESTTGITTYTIEEE